MTTMEWGALGQMLTGMIVGPSQCVLIWYGIHKIGASGFRVGCPTPLPCDEVRFPPCRPRFGIAGNSDPLPP